MSNGDKQAVPAADNNISLWTYKFIPFLLVAAMVAGFTAVFVTHEHTYYWLDYNYYQWATRTMASAFRQTPLLAPWLAWLSTERMYNLIVTMPMAPMINIFGDSRLTYIESIALLYLLPYALLFSAMMVKLSGKSGDLRYYWLGVLLVLLVPSVWAPALRGYPDVASAAVMILCLWLYLDGAASHSGKKLFLVGALLGLAPLIRRHFGYEVIAFLGAVSIEQLRLSFSLSKNQLCAACREFLATGVRELFFLGTGMIVLLVAAGWPFVQNVFSFHYNTLYRSDQAPLFEAVVYFTQTFGAAAWLIAIAGWFFSYKWKLLDNQKARFFLIFACLSAILWLALPDMLAVHYSLHFAPLVVGGLVCFCLCVIPALKSSLRVPAATIAAVYLALNFALGFLPAKILAQAGIKQFRPGMLAIADGQSNSKIWQLFSASYAPWQRSDDAQLQALVNYLRDRSGAAQFDGPALSPNDPRPLIYVAAISNVLEQEILRNCERQLYGSAGDRLLAPVPPCVDSRDVYPLQLLMRCQLAVIADPVQYYIRPSEQRLLDMINICFRDNWEIARDFARLPRAFHLYNNVTVTVYERRRPTTIATACLTLKRMQAYLPERPGAQRDWITTGNISDFWIENNKTPFAFIVPDTGRFDPNKSFMLYVDQLPEHFSIDADVALSLSEPTAFGAARRVSPDALGKPGTLSFCLTLLDANGTVSESTAAQLVTGVSGRIGFTGDRHQATYAVIRLCGQPPTLKGTKQSLQVELSNVQLKPLPARSS